MLWLNYHHLFYFRTIASEGGIAKAAQKLRLGEPTLSTQLRQLEEAFGKNLFERRNRKLILTESGRVALDYANEIFRLGEEMVEVLQDRTVGNQTHVQIGALDSVPKSVLSELVSFAHSLGPCTVSILEGKGDELFRELFAHRIDLILSNFSPGVFDQKTIYSKSVAKVPVSVFASQRHLKLRQNFPDSLQDKPWILPTSHSRLRHDLDHFFKTQKLRVLSVAETQDTSLQRLLAEQGLGLAPFGEFSAGEVGTEKKLIKLGRLFGVYEELWLVRGVRKFENPIAARLMDEFNLLKARP